MPASARPSATVRPLRRFVQPVRIVDHQQQWLLLRPGLRSFPPPDRTARSGAAGARRRLWWYFGDRQPQQVAQQRHTHAKSDWCRATKRLHRAICARRCAAARPRLRPARPRDPAARGDLPPGRVGCALGACSAMPMRRPDPQPSACFDHPAARWLLPTPAAPSSAQNLARRSARPLACWVRCASSARAPTSGAANSVAGASGSRVAAGRAPATTATGARLPLTVIDAN